MNTVHSLYYWKSSWRPSYYNPSWQEVPGRLSVIRSYISGGYSRPLSMGDLSFICLYCGQCVLLLLYKHFINVLKALFLSVGCAKHIWLHLLQL